MRNVAETNDSNKQNTIILANIEAEQSVLGCIFYNNAIINKFEFLLPEHFYQPFHKKIYASVLKLVAKGISATPVTLKSMFFDEPEMLKTINDNHYLDVLHSHAYAIINSVDYAKIVYDLAVKRALLEIGENIINNAYQNIDTKVMDQITEAESKLFSLATKGVAEKGFIGLKDGIASSLAHILHAMKNPKHIIGISTGFTDLDAKLSGFQKSDLLILAGRPAMGKTAFALNLALNAAAYSKEINGGAVALFSLEMSAEQLIMRLLANSSGIDTRNLFSGKLEESVYNKITHESSNIASLPLFIDDTPAITIALLRMRARRLARTHGKLGAIFVDYLQLMQSTRFAENRVVQISEITQGLKAIAKELDTPVIALSQLSRAVESREDKRPMLQDLRESGTIEQDADIVMFIYRDSYYLERSRPKDNNKLVEWLEDMEKCKNKVEIIIAKHRNGPIGTVDLYYDTKLSKFENYNKI